MKRGLLVAAGLVAIVCGVAWLVTDRDDDQPDDEVAKPLAATASTFVPPEGAVVAMQDTAFSSPPTAVRGWSWEGSIDDACVKWRDAYGNWIGATALGDIEGEVVPDQSCTFTGRKDGYSTRLLVAVYGSAPPQATLTVTE